MLRGQLLRTIEADARALAADAAANEDSGLAAVAELIAALAGQIAGQGDEAPVLVDPEINDLVNATYDVTRWELVDTTGEVPAE